MPQKKRRRSLSAGPLRFQPYNGPSEGQSRFRVPKPRLLKRPGTLNPALWPKLTIFPALGTGGPSHIRFRIRALLAFGCGARRES